ncbi:MAG: DUF1273 family protein [Oscillospiraceae bacterium]|nr:DUF1273 family protein [Oscillospiraceae bacterium]
METKRDITCCFTGHRPAKLPWGQNEEHPDCLKLKTEIKANLEGIYQCGYRHFICGMAIGCDMYFAEAVLDLKEKFPDISLEAAIPCGDQPEKWTAAQRQRYNRIIDSCDKISVLQIKYSSDCMLKRNEYMVDHSSLLLAVYNGKPGGTMKTILYADRQGLKTILIEI